MTLGDQKPHIRIQVDQRLALESGVAGRVSDDASVSTEITYFDRVGESYILEGVLAFSGAVESAEERENDRSSVCPVMFHLPFALRIPIAGQPDFLDVKTRIGRWSVEPVAPGYLQLQAELTIQGLNGQNGYAFYCGDQEDWVQPQAAEPAALQALEGGRTEVQHVESAGGAEDEWMPGTENAGVDSRKDASGRQPVISEGDDLAARAHGFPEERPGEGYNEQEWMMEPKGGPAGLEPGEPEADERLTAVFGQPGPDRSAEEEKDTGPVRETAQDFGGREEVLQFEALAKEVEMEAADGEVEQPAANALEPAAAVEAEAGEPDAAAMADAAGDGEDLSADVQGLGTNDEADEKEETKADSDLPNMTDPAGIPGAKNPVAAKGADESEEEGETEAAAAEPSSPADTAASGPKISLVAKKEEAATLKLSGLLYGSVTKESGREQFFSDHPNNPEVQREEDLPSGVQEAAEDVAQAEAETSDAETNTADHPEAVLGEEDESGSLWGAWIQKTEEAKYTLKFRIVQEAESLDQLANRYETPIESLMRANGLVSEQVEAGQVLFIPGRRR